ncbi:35093_t:CDS:2, partial [Racocetra persica]
KPGDEGRDIIGEVSGFTFVKLDRSHVDELETVIRRGNNLDTAIRKERFSLGILVGVEEDRISSDAIDRAISSECDIGVITYHNLCKVIVWLVVHRLTEHILILESENR